MNFRLEITQVGKFPTSWSLTKLQNFGTHGYLLMRGPTLSFAQTKTYSPIFVNLKEKLKKEKIIISLPSHSLCRKMAFPFYFHSFYFYFILFFSFSFILFLFLFFFFSLFIYLILFYLFHYFLNLTLNSM